MNNSLIVFAVCIHSVIGKVIYKRIGQPDPVTIECGVKTSNLDVEWTYKAVDGDQPVMILHLNGKRGSVRKGSAPMVTRAKLKEDKLEIIQVVPSDAGQYICEVNGVEKGSHFLYTISVGVNSPSSLHKGALAVLNCKVSGLGSPPKVEWLRQGEVRSSNGTVILARVALDQNGEWTCRISQGKETHSENLNVDIKALLPTTCATTVKGLGERGQDQDNIPPRLGTSDSLNPIKGWSILDLSLWVWVGIGTGSLVLIILLVVGVHQYCRNRRIRRRRQKMNINRKSLKSNDYCQCKSTPEGPPQRRTRPKPSPLTLQQH